MIGTTAISVLAAALTTATVALLPAALHADDGPVLRGDHIDQCTTQRENSERWTFDCNIYSQHFGVIGVVLSSKHYQVTVHNAGLARDIRYFDLHQRKGDWERGHREMSSIKHDMITNSQSATFSGKDSSSDNWYVNTYAAGSKVRAVFTVTRVSD